MARKRAARATSLRRPTKTRAVKKSAARRVAPRKAAKKTAARKAAKKPAARKVAKAAAPRKAKRAAVRRPSELFARVKGAERREIGHVLLEVGKAGNARVKRMVYPAGFHWLRDMKPVVGTDLCMHAHVGFLVHGEIHIEYPDGCVIEYRAPQIIAIDPGHDGWVVGKEPVVMIEFDFESDTVAKLGMPTSHTHAPQAGPSSVPS